MLDTEAEGLDAAFQADISNLPSRPVYTCIQELDKWDLAVAHVLIFQVVAVALQVVYVVGMSD